MYRLNVTATARANITDVLDRYGGGSPQAAGRFESAVNAALKKIFEAPERYGPYLKSKTLRRLALVRFPYSVIYEIAGNEIVVYTVRHHRRKPFRKPRRR